MQVKVQTVNELTINQLSEDQYKAEKAAGRIKSGEVYACTPSPVKWEDIQNKPDVPKDKIDFEELSHRIPSWQWKVTMPQTVNQTVTATVGDKTYTSDFYAPQGSNVTFSVKADKGYIVGAVSPTSAMLDKDLTATVTAAEASKEVEAGSKTLNIGDQYIEFTIPVKVQVLKITCNGKDLYAKVSSGRGVQAGIFDMDDKKYVMVSYNRPQLSGGWYYDNLFEAEINTPLVISWSSEINAHAIDQDWDE